MPVQTIYVYTCSFCEQENPDLAEITLTGMPEGGLKFDVCPPCTTTAVVANFIAKGEPVKKAKVRAAALKAPAAGKAPVGGKAPPKDEKVKLEQNDAGQWLCPECDYTHRRASSVGIHRAKAHTS